VRVRGAPGELSGVIVETTARTNSSTIKGSTQRQTPFPIRLIHPHAHAHGLSGGGENGGKKSVPIAIR
jgi:hypothetical protein